MKKRGKEAAQGDGRAISLGGGRALDETSILRTERPTDGRTDQTLLLLLFFHQRRPTATYALDIMISALER